MQNNCLLQGGADTSTSRMADREQMSIVQSRVRPLKLIPGDPSVISLPACLDLELSRLLPRLRRQRGRRASSSLPGEPEAASCSGCGARSKAGAGSIHLAGAKGAGERGAREAGLRTPPAVSRTRGPRE